MRRQHHGGQNARDWRRKVAAAALRQKESVFTYKFGLSVNDGDFDFDAAARTYDITEGIERGSLIGLVCAVHLSGFRLFSKVAETRQFLNRSRYPENEFAQALAAHTEIENPSVTVQSIESVFVTPPRKQDGVARLWSADELAKRLFQTWNNRSPREGERNHPELLLAQGIARAVTKAFSGWKELADNAVHALTCADNYLATLGNRFPKLSDLPPLTAGSTQTGTLAFDPESPFLNMTGNEDIWLHQVVAVCAGRLKRYMPEIDPSSRKFASRLTDSIVSSQNNGLSWLFGNGLRFLRQSSIAQIAETLSVSQNEHRRVEQLKEFADAIPVNPFFATDGYAEFRGSVGGKISSWVSNYWKRICELTVLHSQPPDITIPEGLLASENATLFSGQHTAAAGLVALSARLPSQVRDAGKALFVLSGDGVPRADDIATVEDVAGELAELTGQLAMLDNRIQQEIERAQDANDEGRVGSLASLRPNPTKELKEPPKLNRISGGTADAAGELARLETSLNDLIRARREHFYRLAEWTGNTASLDPLPALAERERKALTDRGMDPTLAEADEYALRRLLHRIAGMARRLSPNEAKRVRETMTPLFLKKREANLYFHNRAGALYRHPFSNSRHQPYSIDLNRARATDWLAWLEERAREMLGLLGSGAPANHEYLRDLLSIETFVFTTRLSGLPAQVPGYLAKPKSDLTNIPPLLAAQLDVDEVSRDVALRAFNLFNSAINGLSFRAFRDSFIVRTKFLRLGHDELFYVPKARAWKPPADYRSAKGKISKGLALPAVKRNEAGSILPRETTQGLSRAKFPEGSHALLSQAPHDWFVELDLRHDKMPQLAGLPVKMNADGLKGWRARRRPTFRLAGPPSFKTWLDRALTSTAVKLGDYTLILDQSFKQSLRVEDGEVRLSAEPAGIKAEIAVPVIDARPFPETEAEALFDNIIGIDLGERRIGYAVFSLPALLKSGNPTRVKPTVVGSVAIPAFRRLMAAVRRHRGSRQPNQKVSQTYSTALQQFRENVVGDVCNRIDTLCERYRAFPVLESSVANFETGANQLKLIYGTVLRRYTFSNVDAHKSARSAYWYSANRWQHPYLFVREWNKAQRTFTGSAKPLAIYPGVTIHPAGTSQICHRCGRNALRALRNMPDRTIRVGKDGLIVLADSTIRLLERADYSDRELKTFKRRKQRPPLNMPVPEGARPRDQLERVLRRNMRQQPQSEMSPDTTQARFTCVYTDCGFEGHADENAAVNIGRRFLERIDIEASSRT
ncbi:MAG: type V CRISPR-associated protein Cas12c [Desulfurellaceae bacterium]|nr:type V CRISPR-associated protein Cas12c [Desulfurellaceae bacterium]